MNLVNGSGFTRCHRMARFLRLIRLICQALGVAASRQLCCKGGLWKGVRPVELSRGGFGSADHIPAILKQLSHAFTIQYTVMISLILLVERKIQTLDRTPSLLFFWLCKRCKRCERAEKGITVKDTFNVDLPRHIPTLSNNCNNGFDYAWEKWPRLAFLWPAFDGSIEVHTGIVSSWWVAAHGILFVPG